MMKKLLLTLLVVFVASTVAALDIYDWSTDLDDARSTAADQDKNVFVYFAGSDWCGWCKRLHDEVLTTSRFTGYLRENFVPVLVDFPRGIEQSEELMMRNRLLAESMEIEGFPTVVLVDPNGDEIGRLGYLPGGPTNYIAEVRTILRSQS